MSQARKEDTYPGFVSEWFKEAHCAGRVGGQHDCHPFLALVCVTACSRSTNSRALPGKTKILVDLEGDNASC
jgi:hypothetical protein